MDLALIYFFDQNSDAHDRIFTQRIADLLDDHVIHLKEPFRNAGFGSPADVQRSVSCTVTVLEENLRTEEDSFAFTTWC